MSATTLVTWEEFLLLPERPDDGQGIRYELHDGEVVIVPPPRPLHVKVQYRIWMLLLPLAGGRGKVHPKFPYRPQPNLQYWVADLAYIPQADWDRMPPDQWPVYAPPLTIEVLSPSNTAAKVNRQRIVALSSGAEEFWVVDPEQHTVEVTSLHGARLYAGGDSIPVGLLGAIPVERIFEGL